MEDTQTPTELKQEVSDVAALPPAEPEVTATPLDSQAALSQGALHLSSLPFKLSISRAFRFLSPVLASQKS